MTDKVRLPPELSGYAPARSTPICGQRLIGPPRASAGKEETFFHLRSVIDVGGTPARHGATKRLVQSIIYGR